MPWTNVTSGEEINRCVILARCGRFTVTELCEQFGISRETGYKHLERYAALVLAGLQPRSHRPHHSPQRTDEALEAIILAERLGKENYLPTPTPSPTPPRANRSSGQSPPAPTTRAIHRPPPTPPTVPPTPPTPPRG